VTAVELEALCVELARRLREAVLPALGSHAARAHSGASAHGDITFGIDELAEVELELFAAETTTPLAVLSEDRGVVGPPEAEWLLVVDPVDGTRPALAGFEGACVSIAAAPNIPGATLGDVEVGVVLELKTGHGFVARRGGGVTADDPLVPSANEDLSRLFWAAGYRGRPARDLTDVIGPLVDRSSVGGGYFDPGSAAFILTRVATGQLDAYVDVGPRIAAELPGAEERFRRLGNGEILCNRPYDLAASLLVLRELGLPVTDAWGRPLEAAPLRGGIVSCLAAANEPLHAELLAALDGRFDQLAATPSGASGSLPV